MNVDSQLVDRIVAGVLERLGTPAVDERAGGAPETAAPRGQVACLNEPVVTAGILEQRLNGRREIVFGAKTVLTPSARELLAQQRIAWSRDFARGSASVDAPTWLAIVVQFTPPVQTALDDIEEHAAARWRRELVADASEAARLATSAVCRGDAAGVVAFCAEPHALVCRANRNPRIRGAAVDDAAALRGVVQQMGVNLLAIAPADKGYIELRNILRTYTTAGVPCVPNDWTERV